MSVIPRAPIWLSTGLYAGLYRLRLVVDNTGTLSYRTCTGVGPNYIRTFDGLEYLFPGRCHYTVYTDSVRSISVKYKDCHSYQLCRKVASAVAVLR